MMSFDGTITKEAVVATETDFIAICLGDDLTRIERIGLEAGPLSERLVRELSVLGIVVTLLETRQVRAALSAMIIKTDRKDARGMAHLLRTGWFRLVPRQIAECPRAEGNAGRALDARGPAEGHREQRFEDCFAASAFGYQGPCGAAGKPVFERPSKVTPPWCRFSNCCHGPRSLREQLIILDKWVRDAARADRVCRRLMSAPGVGAIGAMTFRAAVDKPDRSDHPSGWVPASA